MTKKFTDEDFSGARFRNVNFSNVKMVDALLTNANLSGLIDGLVVNGIEVAPLIAAEMSRRYPERDKLFAADPEGLGAALATVERDLERTWERARKLSEDQRQRRVDDEWSVVETIRHLVFVVDGWISRTVLGEDDPFHPIALPPSFLPSRPEGTSCDPEVKPTFDEALDVWRGRLDVVHEIVERLTPEELERKIVTQGPGYPPSGHETQVIGPLWTVLDEIWAHNLFMNRDLDVIEKGSA